MTPAFSWIRSFPHAGGPLMSIRLTLSTLAVAFLLEFGAIYCGAAAPPEDVASSACRVAPAIDGVIDSEEWKGAATVPFEMTVICGDPAGTETRACTLRVMNSANALYVAFQVPDATVDDSISPLRIDAATLAFSKGDELSAGDDRKLIAPGLFRDKHAVELGKDDRDDAKQDGRGAMTRKDGVCSFEWAVALDGDGEDLKARPGDAVRFNVAYFDALQLPLTKARFGGLYGPQFDKSGSWGKVKPASDVAEDGGAAFRGPAWVAALWDRIQRQGGPAALADALKACLDVYGPDFDDPTYHAHSPITHLPTITCPVSVSFTTADMLVPINQVGKDWARPFAKADFPKGFTMDPETLMRSPEGRTTLLDALPASDYEVFPMPASKHGAFELPVSVDRP